MGSVPTPGGGSRARATREKGGAAGRWSANGSKRPPRAKSRAASPPQKGRYRSGPPHLPLTAPARPRLSPPLRSPLPPSFPRGAGARAPLAPRRGGGTCAGVGPLTSDVRRAGGRPPAGRGGALHRERRWGLRRAVAPRLRVIRAPPRPSAPPWGRSGGHGGQGVGGREGMRET